MNDEDRPKLRLVVDNTACIREFVGDRPTWFVSFQYDEVGDPMAPARAAYERQAEALSRRAAARACAERYRGQVVVPAEDVWARRHSRAC